MLSRISYESLKKAAIYGAVPQCSTYTYTCCKALLLLLLLILIIIIIIIMNNNNNNNNYTPSGKKKINNVEKSHKSACVSLML